MDLYRLQCEQNRNIVRNWFDRHKKEIELKCGRSIPLTLDGSYSHETNHLLSDIDLTVISDDPGYIEIIRKYHPESILTSSRKYGWPILRISNYSIGEIKLTLDYIFIPSEYEEMNLKTRQVFRNMSADEKLGISIDNMISKCLLKQNQPEIMLKYFSYWSGRTKADIRKWLDTSISML